MSLQIALEQSEGRVAGAAGFEWDIMICAGDLTGGQYPPDDDDGVALLNQLGALTKHRREDIYNIAGNHDAGYYDQGPGAWFRKWVDPLGENPDSSRVDSSQRPFAIEGTWERYSFRVGNILFLMMSDRNDCPAPVGRGSTAEDRYGGFPAGAVTRSTFEWWRRLVLENQDSIIITVHHHVLRDTSIYSTEETGRQVHGQSGGAEGVSFLRYTIEDEDPARFRFSVSDDGEPGPFEAFLEQHLEETGGPAIDLWVAGHSHLRHPDYRVGKRGALVRKWEVTFLNVSALSLHHMGGFPMSRLLTFREGDYSVGVDCYVHSAVSGAKRTPEELGVTRPAVGWYAPAQDSIQLRHRFQMQGISIQPRPTTEPLPSRALDLESIGRDRRERSKAGRDRLRRERAKKK